MELNLERERTLSDWFNRYGRLIKRFVRSRIDDIGEAEDVAQDVWLRLVRQSNLDEIEHIGGWLYTAARNLVADYYRKKRPLSFSEIFSGQVSEEEDEISDVEGILMEDYLPDKILESKDFMVHLERALANLPEEQRAVFIAHELEEVSFKEISGQTGVPINTLLARKRYAVLRLREYFKALDQLSTSTKN